MLNRKVILINGVSRSGSNILWNIMQSHPQVCSPIGETNQVLHPRIPGLHRVSRLMYVRCRNAAVKRYVDARLYEAKLRNIEHESNRYKTETDVYAPEEIQAAVLCLKALNEDIYLTDLFYSMYDDIHTVGLVRNGYAVCEGLVRRGVSARTAGRLYTKYMSRVVEDSQRLRNYTIVKFEDMVRRPFDTAASLFRFCELQPGHVEKLRFKSKRVRGSDGRHASAYGTVGDKYWFDREAIGRVMSAEINDVQAAALSEADRSSFRRQAGPILEYLAYSQ